MREVYSIKAMAKVQILAVLSMDGCLSDKVGDACWALRPESYDINKLFDAADYELTPAKWANLISLYE